MAHTYSAAPCRSTSKPSESHAERTAVDLNRCLTLLCPSEVVESVISIDTAALASRGIRALLVDLDNTLVPWRSYDIAPEVPAWIGEARNRGMEFCILSNTRSRKRLPLATLSRLAFSGASGDIESGAPSSA